MFNTREPEEMLLEIEASRNYRDGVLEASQQIRQAFVGRYYNSRISSDGAMPENHPFEFSAQVLPKLAYSNPRVNMETGLPRELSVIVRSIEHVANQKSVEHNLKKQINRIAQDYLISFGVACTKVEATARPSPIRYDDGPVLDVRTYRLSPKAFFPDHKASCPEDARFMGHHFIRDKESLLKMARKNKESGWIPEAIEKLSVGERIDEARNRNQEDGPDRKEVLVYEIWVPEVTLEGYEDQRDYSGTIYTIGASVSKDGDKESGWIREPRPFYGPASGPYTYFGAYDVPDHFYCLSPLMAVFDQVKEYNEHAVAASTMAGQYKRLILVDAERPELIDAVNNSRHESVVPVKGLIRDSVIPVDIGGVNNGTFEYLGFLQDRLYRSSGMDQALRGQADPTATATAVSQAAQAAGDRIRYIQQRFADGILDVMKKRCWYYWNSPFFKTRIYGADARSGVSNGGVYQGGPSPETDTIPFEDLMIKMDLTSIEYTSSGALRQQANDRMAVMMNIAPVVPQTPYIRWKEMLEDYGQMTNDENLGQYIDVDMAMRMAGTPEASGSPPKFDLSALSPELHNLKKARIQ